MACVFFVQPNSVAIKSWLLVPASHALAAGLTCIPIIDKKKLMVDCCIKVHPATMLSVNLFTIHLAIGRPPGFIFFRFVFLSISVCFDGILEVPYTPQKHYCCWGQHPSWMLHPELTYLIDGILEAPYNPQKHYCCWRLNPSWMLHPELAYLAPSCHQYTFKCRCKRKQRCSHHPSWNHHCLNGHRWIKTLKPISSRLDRKGQ